jgi:hypothetical protein
MTCGTRVCRVQGGAEAPYGYRGSCRPEIGQLEIMYPTTPKGPSAQLGPLHPGEDGATPVRVLPPQGAGWPVPSGSGHHGPGATPATMGRARSLKRCGAVYATGLWEGWFVALLLPIEPGPAGGPRVPAAARPARRLLPLPEAQSGDLGALDIHGIMSLHSVPMQATALARTLHLRKAFSLARTTLADGRSKRIGPLRN